jgi:hypothetical protein
MLRRFGKLILKKEVNDLASFFQVEIKIRLMVNEIDVEKRKHKRAIYGDERGEMGENESESKTVTLGKIEAIFDKAHLKFPKAEYVYIWGVFMSLHY